MVFELAEIEWNVFSVVIGISSVEAEKWFFRLVDSLDTALLSINDVKLGLSIRIPLTSLSSKNILMDSNPQPSISEVRLPKHQYQILIGKTH